MKTGNQQMSQPSKEIDLFNLMVDILIVVFTGFFVVMTALDLLGAPAVTKTSSAWTVLMSAAALSLLLIVKVGSAIRAGHYDQ